MNDVAEENSGPSGLRCDPQSMSCRPEHAKKGVIVSVICLLTVWDDCALTSVVNDTNARNAREILRYIVDYSL